MLRVIHLEKPELKYPEYVLASEAARLEDKVIENKWRILGTLFRNINFRRFI